MKIECLAVAAALALSQPVLAIDAKDISPADKDPRCLERTTDSSAGDCIIKDEGTPRHRYPPKSQIKSATPAGAKSGASK